MSDRPDDKPKAPVPPQVMKRFEQAARHLGCEHMIPWAQFRLTGTSRPLDKENPHDSH